MKKHLDWREYFLPAHAYENAESLRLHLFFVATCFVTSFFAATYFFMSIYMSGIYFAENMAVSVVVFVSLPFFLKAGVRLSILANLFVALIAIVASLQIYWEGGIRFANTAPWLVVLPAFAMMLQGARMAVLWLIVALLIVIGFSYFTFQGIKFPVMFDFSKDPVFSLLSMMGLVSLITFIFYISETERKKAHDSLEAQNVTLEKLSKEKTKFLQIAAHDLRNPLGVIRGLAESLSDPDLSPEDRQDCLNYIDISTARMSELIKNLLEIQVIDAGKMVVNPQQFSLTELINSYVAQMSHMASVKQTSIEVSLPEAEVSVFSDPARIEQILDNYVSNAIKYSPIGSRVFIVLTEQDGRIEINVSDEGPGISAEEMKKLFLQFSTVSSVPRQGEHATGLGLAIVKKIADTLDAEVGCTSEKGKGCTFYVRLPKV
jgi:signal transduction histidine kinase